MNRRSFIALASGLFVPWEPERVYSFLPAWRLIPRDNWGWHRIISSSALVLSEAQCPNTHYQFGCSVTILSPHNLLDVTKTAEAWGQKLPPFRDSFVFGRTPDEWSSYQDSQRRSRELGHDRGLNMDRYT